MKKNWILVAVTTAAMTFFAACKKNDVPVSLPEATKQAAIERNSVVGREDSLREGGECPVQVTQLVAGQHMDAGTVSVTNDGVYIYVTYTAANGFFLQKTHLYAGACEAIPVNKKGNAVPGRFPYAATHNNVTTYTAQFFIEDIGLGNCGCIAAHAEVVKLGANGNVVSKQSAWGKGNRINTGCGGNWAMAFSYCVCDGGL